MEGGRRTQWMRQELNRPKYTTQHNILWKFKEQILVWTNPARWLHIGQCILEDSYFQGKNKHR